MEGSADSTAVGSGPSPAGLQGSAGGGLNFSMYGILKTPKMSRAEAEAAFTAAKAGEEAARAGGARRLSDEGGDKPERATTPSFRREDPLLTPPSSVRSVSSMRGSGGRRAAGRPNVFHAVVVELFFHPWDRS